ncbi:NADP-dependent oxidoreductase [Pseudonocardia sp. KRD-184]|uniref:NADP-dependent oxidoreductase n=2 Tax=Pseudonocardia oceani TaxID=2792013 RepID=A0ABS6UF34_9PSEU|nr:NADP-dependent oxidoreductase [Pseudonocardia oceani]MBW0096106.1 NADP-dependent oxidoreductase [Pseudonocardia oceani]MBW0109600.1 NADP-dependent oxidoreductase [Pseudonocardia oceani]MBW0120950.1 NADP-dependent oxidoreductase [Pseudonocardia oceani]MBW0130857.1 NADP-dependent oxidoreductase [Pseudonocardia oceani]
MRAVGVREPGGPAALRLVELPVPEPGPGEIRIRVRAAAVNPTDTVYRQLGPAPEEGLDPPWIPGMELAGTVDAVGDTSVAGTAPWSVGDRVMAIVMPRRRHGGAYAEQVVVPADAAAAIPDGIGDAEASTLPMNGLTVVSALAHLALPPGAVLGVTGAAGAVGGYAIELGRAAGLTVVADASAADEELVASLGADVVVRSSRDPREEVAAFRAAVPGGVDGLLDAAVLDAGALGIVRDGGALATVRFWDGPAERGIRVHPVRVRDHLHDGAGIARLADLVVRGRLTLRLAGTVPAAEAASAHERLEAGGVRGRLVLTF